MLLKRTTLLSQPENEKVYSLGDYVAVRSGINDWFMCVISEINDPLKEVKVRLMRKSGQYFLLSKKLKKWFPKRAIFHRCSIPSIDNRTRYSFDAINTKGSGRNKGNITCRTFFLIRYQIFFEVLRTAGTPAMTVGHYPNQVGVWGRCKPPSGSRTEPWWGSRGRSPWELLRFYIF